MKVNKEIIKKNLKKYIKKNKKNQTIKKTEKRRGCFSMMDN